MRRLVAVSLVLLSLMAAGPVVDALASHLLPVLGAAVILTFALLVVVGHAYDGRSLRGPDVNHSPCPGSSSVRTAEGPVRTSRSLAETDRGARRSSSRSRAPGPSDSHGRLPMRRRLTVAQRIWRNMIVADSGCWLWTASRDAEGYGRLTIAGTNKCLAHRIAYETFIGPIPKGMQVDHTCHVPGSCSAPCPHRACVNPAHLEAVTPRENTMRSGAPTAANAVKTHCKRGHPLDEQNTKVDSSGRHCRACIAYRATFRRSAHSRSRWL